MRGCAAAVFIHHLDEAKWRVESLVTTDSSQASPTASTWYNKGGSLAVPIGRWRVEYAAELEVTRAAAGALDVFATYIGILNILIVRGIPYFDCYQGSGRLGKKLVARAYPEVIGWVYILFARNVFYLNYLLPALKANAIHQLINS